MDAAVVPAGATLAHRWTDLVVEGAAEVYATESAAQSLADRLRLWSDPQGSIVVHAVPDDLGDLMQDRVEMPAPVVAVDLLDSGDSRSHRAGQTLWTQAVQRWRDEAVQPRVRRGVRRSERS